MNNPVLFIQGGGQGAYEEAQKMAASLQDALGACYDVRCPMMPGEAQPAWAAWSDRIASELAALNDGVILVGHSLGASMLLKFLSEKQVEKTIGALCLIAPPYWGVEDWDVSEYTLHEHFASKLPDGLPLFFYHSRDDEWVPFEHLALYREQLPHATIHTFEDRGHQLRNDLSGVAQDIQRLQQPGNGSESS